MASIYRVVHQVEGLTGYYIGLTLEGLTWSYPNPPPPPHNSLGAPINHPQETYNRYFFATLQVMTIFSHGSFGTFLMHFKKKLMVE